MNKNDWLLITILFLFGCGIKGDPQPPAETENIQAAEEIKIAPPPIKAEEQPSTKKIKKKGNGKKKVEAEQ